MANSNVHPFFIEACNIGSHFFRDTPITVSLFSNVGATGAVLCNIPFNSVTTPFYSSRSVTSIYTRGPISNSTFFLWNNSLSYPLYTPCNIASFNGSACNLYFNAATPVGFTYGGAGKNFYYDTFSLTVRDNTLTSNWSPTGVSHGIRVESGGSELYPAIGLFGADFNNNCNINVGIYSNEMQLVYGGYRTFCNAVFSGRLNGYLNYDQFFNPFSASGYTYPNYSVINSSNKRYVTMKYSFRSNVNSSNWQAANIRFTYDDAPFTYDTFTFLGIDVFYRIVASNDNSATTTNLTTAWLDANTIALSPPNANTKNTNGTPGAFNYVEISGDSNNTKVFFPSLNYSNVDFSFYVRVGIPMNCNISLRYIDLTPLSVGAVPGNLTNLVISNAQTLPLTNSLMSWNRADDSIAITNFYINYAAIGNSISGVTYPRRHLNTIISDTGSFNSNVTSVPTSQLTFNYTFTPSNYDTYYSGTVFASNISGTTPTLSNNSINSTPLPANTGADFASGLGLCNTNYAAIIYSRTGTLFKTVTTVAGSLIYNSNNFFQSGGISHPFQIYSASGLMSGITVNPTNTTVGPGLNTVNWSITLLSNGTQSATQSYTYPYSIYSSASNVQIINNTVWAWSNIGSADMYTGDIYRSNFYAITTPRIWVKTANILPGIPNRLFIRDVTRGLSNLVDFYVEIQNSSPTGSISLSNGGINFCNICGISVITSTSFNFWITANNIGSYFYFNPPVTASLSYTGGSGTFGFDPVNTVFYSNISLTSTQLSNPPLPSVVYFYWSNVAIATTSFGTTYALSGSTTNLFGTNTISGSFAPYYDPASIAMLTCNVRVESGGNTETPAAGDFGAAYNNNTPINTGLYGSELQLANGGYFSPRNTNSFSNYTTFFSPSGGLTNPNYSGLATNAWRYTTFLFSELRTANISNKVDTITYRLNWVNGFTPGIIGSPAASSTNTNSFLLDTTAFQMRIRFNSNTPTTTNDSSQWLNMNSNRGSAISISEKNTASIFCTSNISNYYFGSNLTFTVKVPDGCGYNSFSNYLRIGLNPGGYTNGLGLSNIQYIGQTEFNVPSLFTYSCNLSGSYTTTITLNLIQGLPTNTYFRLSNFLFYSNAGNTYSLSNTTTALIDPTIANYTAATASIIGNYSNLSIIYRPDNSEFWRNNYLFRINGLAPTLADFSVLSEGSNTFNARITPTLTNAAIQPQPVVFYWNVSNATPPSGGPTNVGPTALQGPITSGTTGQITSDICTFNRNFTFRIFASNAIGISGTSNIASRSGPQQSQPQPSITITTTTMLGSVLSYTISFGGRVGILSWGLNRNGGGFSVNNNTTADSISGTADTPSGYGYFSFYGKGFSSTAINTVSGCLTQSATASGGSSTTDFSIVTPSFNAANVTANTGSFTITIALNNVPTPPTFTPAVSLQTIWAVSGGSATITSQTNNGCSITASAANTTYTVSATYRMNDGTEIRDSSAGTQNVSVGGFLPVTGTISGRTFNTDITIDVTSTTPPNGATTSGGRTGARITGTPNYSLTDDTGNLIVTQTTTTLRLQMNNVTSISPFIDYSVSWTT
jgi:hypothetical protein